MVNTSFWHVLNVCILEMLYEKNQELLIILKSSI